MRVTKFARNLIGIASLFVSGVAVEAGCFVASVRPSWREPRCGKCGRRAPGYDRRPERRWVHLGLGRTRCLLRYAPRRVCCPDCGVRVERVPWARPDSAFSADFEETAAYLAQITDRTTVAKTLGISWSTVGNIVERIVAERLDPGRFDGLRRIGADEFGYLKRQRYVTVVVDHDRQRVVWAGEGRGAQTLGLFFDELGAERAARLEVVTIDMAAGYIKAVEERAPQAQIVFDRFHVQRLASDAVDEVRRDEVNELEGTAEARAIKRTRYPLLKRPWNLTRRDRQKLADVQANNQRLYRAYLLKETLADALDLATPEAAGSALDDWISWAAHSRLEPFQRVSRTIRKHRDRVLAYVRYRLTNGLVEGINNKLRTIARRAYGFHSAVPLIAMLHLCCSNIVLSPPLPGPLPT
jgi:transposase